MDEQKNDNQDLVVGNDGNLNQETQDKPQETVNSTGNIEVKTEEEPQEPSVNETAPPPEETVLKEEDKISPKEEQSVEEAVNFIAGEKSTEDIKEESESDNEVVEAPDSKESTESSADEHGVVSETTTETIKESSETTPSESIVNPEKVASLSQPIQDGMPNEEQNKPHEHRNNNKLTVIVTVFVALMLSGAAVFAYISAQSNTEESSQESNSQIIESEEIPVNEVTPANQEDVDSTLDEIDESINSLDSSELSEDTITDDALGL